MGNMGSIINGRRNRRNHSTQLPPPPPQPQPEITADQYIFAAESRLPSQSPSPTNQSPPQSYGDTNDHHHHLPLPAITVPLPPLHSTEPAPTGEWYPYGFIMPNDTACVQQKAKSIINDVNLKKETLRLEPDRENPGKFLVTFTFDAIADGSITVMFFVKEGADYILTPTIFTPVTVQFKQALGQIFKQPSGTGVDFSACEEAEIGKEPETDVYDLYPLVVKMDTFPNNQSGSEAGNTETRAGYTMLTYAMFEKTRSEYQVRVLRQILYVNEMRYELQEIYGVGNFLAGDCDEDDPGKECVICLSEPRNTTALPCRHMCMCNGCARVLRFQTTKCPICRQPIERLLEIKVDYEAFQEGRLN